MAEVALLGLAGAVGALGRFALSALDRLPDRGWPIGTLAANLLGCAALGVVAAGPWGDGVRVVVGAGLLGGLTTFSTVVVQARALGRARGLAYVAGSGVTGVALVVAGAAVGGRL